MIFEEQREEKELRQVDLSWSCAFFYFDFLLHIMRHSSSKLLDSIVLVLKDILSIDPTEKTENKTFQGEEKKTHFLPLMRDISDMEDSTRQENLKWRWW